jgi:F-box-like
MSGCVSRLPDEVILKILTYIPKDQFLSIRLVDKRFNRISKIGSLWETVSFPGITIYDENVLRPPRRKEVVVIKIVIHHIANFIFFIQIFEPPDMRILQVDLCFPRTEEQLRQLACHVLPFVGRHVRELKITGFHVVHEPWEIPEAHEPEPKTLSSAILIRIKASCHKLKTLVIRKCRLEENATEFGDYLPKSLENLSFIGCRYTNVPHVPNM